MQTSATRYTLGEEIAHAVTHGIGVLLSIAGLAVLVAFAARYGDAWHVVSSSIYGATLILLYSASTLYHSIPSPAAKQIFRHLDHAAIFLLIAGTYTPFALVSLRGPWGWSLFGVIWGLAIAGVIAETATRMRYPKLSLILYITMGWLVVIAAGPMIDAVETGGLVLLVLGGLAYTLGAIFYAWERLAYNHAIWHLFVLAGSVFHFFSILYYVVPGRP